MSEATKAKEMACPIRPTSMRIIVKEDGFKYTGRLIVPDNVQRRPTSGIVEAVGDKVGRLEYEQSKPAIIGEEVEMKEVFVPTFKIGDHVVYGLYSGTVINFKGFPTYRSLSEEEIIGWLPTEIELEGVGT